MPPSFVLSLKAGVSVAEEGSDRVTVHSPAVPLNHPQYTFNLEGIAPGLLAAIRMLAGEGATEETLSETILQQEGISGLPKFYYYLQKFIDVGIICHTVLSEELPLARRVPLSPFGKFSLQTIERDSSYVLSRFAYCRRDGEHLVVESPLAYGQIVLPDWKGAALIAELAKPQTVGELGAKITGISEEAIELFLSLLLSSKMLGLVGEDESETLIQWEFHDLLFHSRTRTGRHGNPQGRTYPFLGKIEPLPAVKPKMSGDIIELYKPDIEELRESDYPFTLVLEERKSIRSHNNEAPITEKQLGEFLYRTARIRKIIQTEREELSNRPYVSGGGAYEFEIYPVINICKGIPSGLYHYRPLEHQLCRIAERNSDVEALLEDAWRSNRQRDAPQILLVLAARFQRIAWTYESIAHTTLLKNAGALYQAMYLVATAMNLAPCGLGNGNSDLFARAAGTDYYAETSVGEFILGSKPQD